MRRAVTCVAVGAVAWLLGCNGSSAPSLHVTCCDYDLCGPCDAPDQRTCPCRGEYYCTSSSGASVPCPEPDAGPPDAGDLSRCGPIGATCAGRGGPGQVCVPSGVFTMGSDLRPGSGPPHQVYVSAFWIDVNEVTVADYRACVMTEGCQTPDDARGNAYLFDPANDDKPMTDLSYDEMKFYCGLHHGDLPTEAQWERAARYDDGRTYPWGEETGCDRAAWNGCVDSLAPVGSHPAGQSQLGLMDMAGNGYEVTRDGFRDGGYSAYLLYHPCDPYIPLGRPNCYVARSCDTSSAPNACTTFARHRGPSAPGPVSGGGPGPYTFRCVP